MVALYTQTSSDSNVLFIIRVHFINYFSFDCVLQPYKVFFYILTKS